VPAFTKGLATENSFESHPATPGSAIFPDRLCGVLGTAWCKPAMLAQERAQDQLVGADDGQQNFFHC